MNQPTLDDMRKVIGLSELPDEHLQWLLDHCIYKEYEDGTEVVKLGDPVDYMWIMLDGIGKFYMDINGQKVHFYNFENNKESGGIGGLFPYSRMKASPGYSYAVGKVKVMQLHKDYFQELEKLNPQFIQRLIAYMTDRARWFATMQLQQEKVSALGKLSAGIAHELNNPASAINRISDELNQRLMDNFDLTKKLLQHGVKSEAVDTIHLMVGLKEFTGSDEEKISILRRMEMEDEMRDWLLQMQVKKNGELSETFINSGITIDDLKTIHISVGDKPFCDVITWLENLLSSRRIIRDLGQASSRISRLVKAIKSHVHMDRTNDLQPTNVSKDVEDALTLLGHKLRDKNIELERKYSEPLPDTDAYIGELNQVWMNIIDNAIYAVPKNGKITIEIFQKNKNLIVNIIDNGSGIPAEIIPKIFDPFFSTKKVGEGTGIGLDLVARIIRKHDGEIKVDSKPGRTEFSICIPVRSEKKQ